jgi:putative sigma-54 modulation protein
MKIEFTGRQTEISEELQRLSERKLAKLGKLLPPLARAHVILSADKRRRVAEISLRSRQLDLVAIEVTEDFRRSIAGAIEKLERQAQRQRTKRRARKGAASPRLSAAAATPAERGAGGPRVIRSRRAAVKPMTLDEATLELDGRGDGVLVYRDANSERVSVLFRRRDGNLGLIEPEA